MEFDPETTVVGYIQRTQPTIKDLRNSKISWVLKPVCPMYIRDEDVEVQKHSLENVALGVS